MRRISFLLFLALTNEACGQESLGGGNAGAPGRAGVPLGGDSELGGAAGLSWAGSTGVSPPNAGFGDFSGSGSGTGYVGEFGAGERLNSAGSGAWGSNDNAGGAGTGVGSSRFAGSYGDSSGSGSTGGTFGDIVDSGSVAATGLGSGAGGSALGPLVGLRGNAVEMSNAEKLALRRLRGRIAGAIVGTALTGLVLGGLIGGLRRLRQNGRLRHHGTISGFGATSYERYGDGYGYRSRHRSGMFYGGYYRGCSTCLRERRPCFGVGCN